MRRAPASTVGLELVTGPVALHAIGASVSAAMRPRFHAARVALETDLLPANVIADSDCVAEIVRNLLLNALKCTAPGGQVTVASRSAADGAQVSVSDPGTGLAPEEHIFDGSSWGTDALGAGGTGVGVAVVLRLVTAHHGAVDISSLSDGGRVFTVRFARETRRPGRARRS